MSDPVLTLAQMTRRPLFHIPEDTSVESAQRLARREQLHHLPVVRGATLVGMVCTCDLRNADPASPVSRWMRTPVATLPASASPMDAARLMNERAVGSVVVYVDDVASGLITRADLMRAEPATEEVLLLTRCSCCGLTRHLSRSASGEVRCIYCSDPEPEEAAAESADPPRALPNASVISAAPLASLIRDHQLIELVAEALLGFAGRIRFTRSAPLSEVEDLYSFVRVFDGFADCAHHEKEEAVLLPFLARHGFAWTQGPLAEVRREHRQERNLISALGHAAACEEPWSEEQRCRVFATASELAVFQVEHITKENTLLFPAVLERLSTDEQQALAAELAAFDVKVGRNVPLVELMSHAHRLIQLYPAGVASVSANSGRLDTRDATTARWQSTRLCTGSLKVQARHSSG